MKSAAIPPFTPKLLILREKHGDRHFNIPCEAMLHKVALMILEGRLEVGYWYNDPSKDPDPKKPDYTDMQEILALKGSVKLSALSALREYEREVLSHREKTRQFRAIQKAVADKDGKTAWELLQERDYEYEGVELVSFDTTYR